MSEQVFRVDYKMRDLDPRNQHKEVLRTAQTVWAGPDKVSLLSSEYVTGINTHSGKRYFRWSTNSARGFYRHKSGTIIPFEMNHQKRNIVPVNTFAMLGSENRLFRDEASVEFSLQVKKNLNITKFSDLYPIAEMYGLNCYSDMIWGLRTKMRENDFRAFTSRVFGKSNVRKDLVKAAAKTDPVTVWYASEFRNMVPVDWIVDFLRNNERDPDLLNDIHRRSLYHAPYTGGVRKLLSHVDERTKKNLLGQRFTSRDMRFFNDSMLIQTGSNRVGVRNYDAIENNRYRSWQEIHDALHPVRPARAWPNKPTNEELREKKIALIPLAQEFHDKEIEGMKFIAATDHLVMHNWSDEMSNCIRSYTSVAESGVGVYLGVYKENKLLANIEIKKEHGAWRVFQILGKYNRNLQDSDRLAIEGILEGKDIDVSQYWGKPFESAVNNNYIVAADAMNLPANNANIIQHW